MFSLLSRLNEHHLRVMKVNEARVGDHCPQQSDGFKSLESIQMHVHFPRIKPDVILFTPSL
jgi:hypothetical protein